MKKRMTRILAGSLLLLGISCGLFAAEPVVGAQTEEAQAAQALTDSAAAGDGAQEAPGAEEAVEATGVIDGMWTYDVRNDGIYITDYSGADPHVTVPSKFSSVPGKSVVSLGSATFRKNIYLVSVSIPATVRVIGGSGWDGGCFYGCTNLGMVTGMAGVETIGTRAFEGCTALTSVPVRTAKLKEIHNAAFKNCTVLADVTFPASLTNVGEYAFENTAITSITVPATVAIGRGAFYKCQKLASASVSSYVSRDAFMDCPALASVNIRLRGIGQSAFENCTALKSLALTEDSTTQGNIDNCAFKNCTSLPSVSVPKNIRVIGSEAFSGCTSLASVGLVKGLLEVGEYAFWNIAAKNIVVPNTVLTIRKCAFRGKEGNGPDSILIPNSVTWLEYSRWDGTICGNNTVIKSWEGSAAHTYATEHEIAFEPQTAVPSTGIVFTQKTRQLVQDSSKVYALAYTLNPANTTDAVTWESSAPEKVSVNGWGEVTPKGVGTATIIATTTSGRQDRMNIEVVARPDRVTLDQTERTLMMGSSLKLTATVYSQGKIRSDVRPIFTTSNPALATVAQNGTVKCLREGVATIRAACPEYDIWAECRVTIVSNKPASVSFATAKKTIVVGHASTQKATIIGALGAMNIKPEYKSSNNKIAKVDKNGKVTALKDGSVKITAKAGGKKATYKVTVVTAKLSKKGRTLKITTVPKARVQVKASKKVLGSSSKRAKSDAKGRVSIKFKKTIRGTKVTVKVTRSGYKTKTIVKKY